MERIYMSHDSALNLNPNKINNIVALTQNDDAKSGILRTKRWQNRTCLEVLERYQNAPGKIFGCLQIYKFILLIYNLFSFAKH
jgi:hypothetical protein